MTLPLELNYIKVELLKKPPFHIRKGCSRKLSMWKSNFLDKATVQSSPHRYASFLMGLSRGFGLMAGVISSTATGFLISQVGHLLTICAWQVSFRARETCIRGLVGRHNCSESDSGRTGSWGQVCAKCLKMSKVRRMTVSSSGRENSMDGFREARKHEAVLRHGRVSDTPRNGKRCRPGGYEQSVQIHSNLKNITKWKHKGPEARLKGG